MPSFKPSRMHTVAKFLGQLLMAIAGFALYLSGLAWWRGDTASGVAGAGIALGIALPGWLFFSWGRVAERRRRAAELVQTRNRFTIDEVAAVLRASSEVAHVFIADQIRTRGLELTYQQETRGYARRGLPAAVSTPRACASCGVVVAPTDAGFCPSCGARWA
ncbi:MAG TPA: hypothetical protein VFB81_15865 [Myxococcales bacterium]|nr:hypothetical protein [Myxococcales bacterium]